MSRYVLLVSINLVPNWYVRVWYILLYYDLDLSIKMPIIEEEQFR